MRSKRELKDVSEVWHLDTSESEEELCGRETVSMIF